MISIILFKQLAGYISTKDLNGLEQYYSQLLEDCQRSNNLNSLNPEVINNPAIYSILASKYYKADELGIHINLDIFLNLNTLNMQIYELTIILGILLDNAIEASAETQEKIIHVNMKNDSKCARQLIIIENTYSNKDVDTEQIYEKGYTTKSDIGNKHGLGLWKVRKILHRNNNLNLYTTKNEHYFKQQLEIYI